MSRSILSASPTNEFAVPNTKLTSSNHIILRPRTIMSQKDISDALGAYGRFEDWFTLVEESITACIIAFGEMELDGWCSV